jgi:hypothetical protein
VTDELTRWQNISPKDAAQRKLNLAVQLDITAPLNEEGCICDGSGRTCPRHGDVMADARSLRLVVLVSDPIAQCPTPRPRSCDQAYAWLVAQRWHAVPHERCPLR